MMSAMTPQERAAAQELLEDLIEWLKTHAVVDGCSLDARESELHRKAIDLRRQLAIDDELTKGRASNSSALQVPQLPFDWAAPMESLAFSRAATTPSPSEPGEVRRLRSWRDPSLRGKQIQDCTLSPVVRLLIGGVCFLAWLIEPVTTDPTLGTSLLMFLRFVPVFIIGGSQCGRAGRGAIIGISLFFTLLAIEALSILLWDAHPVLQICSFKPARHAGNLANLLYLLAGLGVLLCAAATIAMRQRKQGSYHNYLRWSVQVVIAVQLAIVVELGYTGLRQAIGADRNYAGVSKIVKNPLHYLSQGS